ncbi:hypothetical protein Vretimale_18205, partial [Volvox reticuliferus]
MPPTPFSNCSSLPVTLRLQLQRRCACGAVLCFPWRSGADSAPHHPATVHDRHLRLPSLRAELPRQNRDNRAYPPAISSTSKSSQVETLKASDGSGPAFPQQGRQAGPYQGSSSFPPPPLGKMPPRQKQHHQQQYQTLQQQKQQQQRPSSATSQNPGRRQQLGSSPIAGPQGHELKDVRWTGGPRDGGVMNGVVVPAAGGGGAVGDDDRSWITDGKGRGRVSRRGKWTGDRALCGKGSAAELPRLTAVADDPNEVVTEPQMQPGESEPFLLPHHSSGLPVSQLLPGSASQPSTPPLESVQPPPEPPLQWRPPQPPAARQQKQHRSRRPLRSRRLIPYTGDVIVYPLSADISSAQYDSEDEDGVEDGLMELLWSSDRQQSVDAIFRDGAAATDVDSTAAAAAVHRTD